MQHLRIGFAFGLGIVAAQYVATLIDWIVTVAYYVYFAPTDGLGM
jgi:hypothetical protein